MRKKLLALMMVGVFSFSMLTACGGDSDSGSDSSAETTEETTEEADTEEAADDAAEEEAVEEDASADESVYDNFDKFYMGITDDEDTYMLLAFGNDGTFGMVEFFEVSSQESGSWVGDVETDGDMLSISDENNGTTLTFSVTEQDDGYLLDMGDVGAALVGETDRDTFVEAAQNVDAGTEPQF